MSFAMYLCTQWRTGPPAHGLENSSKRTPSEQKHSLWKSLSRYRQKESFLHGNEIGKVTKGQVLTKIVTSYMQCKIKITLSFC